MRLSDHFLAATGTVSDIGGFATNMRPHIKQAQRFEVADEVAKAAGRLIHSRPSTLLAALPLCRLPYDVMWLEYRGGLASDAHARAFDGAPVPWKQGVLIQSMPGGQQGFMTVAWMHMIDTDNKWLHPVNISPISIYFDWRQDGDVREIVHVAHRKMLEVWRNDPAFEYIQMYVEHLETKWISDEWTKGDQRIRAVMSGLTGWKEVSESPKEHAAMRALDRHMIPGLSPNGIGLVTTLLPKTTDKEAANLILKWEADMQGEGGWVQCFLVMLNSRNPVVEHADVDLCKVNKARKRAGKAQFMPYAETFAKEVIPAFR